MLISVRMPAQQSDGLMTIKFSHMTDLKDRSGWRVEFKKTATEEQIETARHMLMQYDFNAQLSAAGKPEDKLRKFLQSNPDVMRTLENTSVPASQPSR
jgi:hypothetical protein